MKSLRCILSLLLIAAYTTIWGQAEQVKVSILGDSYSTYKGYLPEGNAIWYGIDGQYSRGNDVMTVNDTWWYKLIHNNGLHLEVNDSWSGSTICTTGYYGKDATNSAFINRVQRLGNPDVILVFGGTNDMWAGAPIGDYKYSNWTTEDLKKFRPALCCLFARLKSRYPDALIYNIENTELKKEYYETCEKVCAHYGINRIRLHHISKQLSHPSADGMNAIYQQVWQEIGRRITAGKVK